MPPASPHLQPLHQVVPLCRELGVSSVWKAVPSPDPGSQAQPVPGAHAAHLAWQLQRWLSLPAAQAR